MSENKESTRLSFAKDKVGNFPKGATGITGTSHKAVQPSEEIIPDTYEPGNLSYNSSELLFKNLDALGKKMNFNNSNDLENEITEPEEDNLDENNVDEWDHDMLENLSEEEVIQNLNQHLGYRPAKVDLALRVDKNGYILPDYLLRQVYRPETFNGKTISQNIYIPEPSISERKIIETNTASNKDLFCRNCGSQYLETDNFCGGCGNKRN